MKFTSSLLLAALSGALTFTSGATAHAQTPEPTATPASIASNRAEPLLKIDAEFSKLSETAGAEKACETYLAADAVSPMAEMEHPADRGTFIAQMKEADANGLTLKWTPIRGDLASSGDFGYTYGKWSLVKKEGAETLLHGYYTTVWKKGADGVWKAVFDMGNKVPN